MVHFGIKITTIHISTLTVLSIEEFISVATTFSDLRKKTFCLQLFVSLTWSKVSIQYNTSKLRYFREVVSLRKWCLLRFFLKWSHRLCRDQLAGEAKTTTGHPVSQCLWWTLGCWCQQFHRISGLWQSWWKPVFFSKGNKGISAW